MITKTFLALIILKYSTAQETTTVATTKSNITIMNTLCNVYKNGTAYIASYYEPQNDMCTMFIKFPKTAYLNLTKMCNQIVEQVGGRCQICNSQSDELGTYLNQSLITLTDTFYLGLERDDKCGAWNWVGWNGTKVPEETSDNSTACSDNRAVFSKGRVMTVTPDFTETTGFLCQCVSPKVSDYPPSDEKDDNSSVYPGSTLAILLVLWRLNIISKFTV